MDEARWRQALQVAQSNFQAEAQLRRSAEGELERVVAEDLAREPPADALPLVVRAHEDVGDVDGERLVGHGPGEADHLVVGQGHHRERGALDGAAQARPLATGQGDDAGGGPLGDLRQAFVQPEGTIAGGPLAKQGVGVLVEQQGAKLSGRMGRRDHVDPPVEEADGLEGEAVTVGA